MPEHQTADQSKDVLEIIRNVRNDLIKDFLDERILIEYLSTQFRVLEISQEKMTLIKSDLQKLLIAPVDLNLYAPLLQQYKETGSEGMTDGIDKLFYSNIEQIIKKHIY